MASHAVVVMAWRKKNGKVFLRQEFRMRGKMNIRMSRYQVASLRRFDGLKIKMEQEMSVK